MDTIAAILAAVAAVFFAIPLTVVLFILVLPEKKAEKQKGFFKLLADIFNFRDLLIEKILKILYTFITLFCLIGGLFILFVKPVNGLIMMIGGPIAARLVFEIIMMFVLLVKNTIEINKKLKYPEDEPAKAPAVEAPAQPEPEPEPAYRFCTVCGTKYDANKGGCPNGCQQ